MTNSRTAVGSILLAGLAVVSVAGCGDSAENGIEQLIESQGGGDVELDLSGDGDGFSIETEDGAMTIDGDGNFVITDESGNTIVGSADDEGNVVVESEDGSFSASGDDGEFNMDSDDGSFSMSSDGSIPEEWPGDVPEPDMDIVGSSIIAEGDAVTIGLTGTTTLDGTDFVDTYGDALLSAGFEETSSYTDESINTRVYDSAAYNVSVSTFDSGTDGVTTSVNLTSNT